MTTLTGPSGATYQVGTKQLGKTEEFTLYECTLPDGRKAMLKIAATVGMNGHLDREAYILQTLKEEADLLEEEYAKKTDHKNLPLNNHFFFPELIETFVSDEQGKRRVTILGVSHICEALEQLMPLSFLVESGKRVDPRSSAWILGKLLKLLVFTQPQGFSLGEITGENILINAKEHFVCIFDWTKAGLTIGTPISEELAAKEIALLAKEVLAILGAAEDGSLPADEQLADDQYENFLKQLALGTKYDSFITHKEFYELIRSLWPREYHPFTTKTKV